MPLVCSTFIWAAVQEANRRGGKQITLDGRVDEPSKLTCAPERQLRPRPKVQSLPTPDGLYFYDAAGRTR